MVTLLENTIIILINFIESNHVAFSHRLRLGEQQLAMRQAEFELKQSIEEDSMTTIQDSSEHKLSLGQIFPNQGPMGYPFQS
jgi:hypothetical protein